MAEKKSGLGSFFKWLPSGIFAAIGLMGVTSKAAGLVAVLCWLAFAVSVSPPILRVAKEKVKSSIVIGGVLLFEMIFLFIIANSIDSEPPMQPSTADDSTETKVASEPVETPSDSSVESTVQKHENGGLLSQYSEGRRKEIGRYFLALSKEFPKDENISLKPYINKAAKQTGEHFGIPSSHVLLILAAVSTGSKPKEPSEAIEPPTGQGIAGANDGEELYRFDTNTGKYTVIKGNPEPEARNAESRKGPRPRQSSWDASVACIVQYLKENLNDADSYEGIDWSELKDMGDHYAVRHKYRAKNAFGAKVIQNQLFHFQNPNNGVDCKMLWIKDFP